MLSKFAILSFSASLAASKGHKHKLSEEQLKLRAVEAHDYVRTKHGNNHPKLQQYGYNKVVGDADWGLELETNLDLGFGYKLIWENYEQFLILNPELFIQAATDFMMQINMLYFKPYLDIKFNIYKYTPMDTFFAYNIESYDESCFGMDWKTDSLLLEISAGY